jgi:hypothetical protein
MQKSMARNSDRSAKQHACGRIELSALAEICVAAVAAKPRLPATCPRGMLARSGRTLLDSGKHLARPTTCLQIDERREKMNEVGAEPLIVMAEPDLNPSEGFALAPRGCDQEFEQG